MTRVRSIGLSILSFIFLVSAALATPPRTPITISLSISSAPRLYEPATVTVEVRSALDAPGTVVELILPEGVTAERTRWIVDLQAGKPVIFTTTWSFVNEPGNVSLSARAIRAVGPGEVWGEMASLPLHLSPAVDHALEGWRVDQVPVTDLLEAGDALVISTDSTPFSFPSAQTPSEGQPAPPGIKPASRPGTTSPPEPSALGTVTLTGKLSYQDRSGVLRDLDQQMLEIRRGDGAALSPRVYCFTDVDGTFSCSLPYTGTTLRVWARSYTAFSFGSGSTNRLGVFSGIEVNAGCGSDSIDCSYPVQTPEVSCGDGQTCSVGSQYIALGEPWSGAHQMTQDLIRAWKKLYFDTRHPAGTVPGPGRITYPVPAGHGTHAHVRGIVDGWISIEPPNQEAADVVNHEYGHVVMSNLWAGYSPNWPSSDCPSPHYISQVSGPGCALSEGFANFWAWYSNQFYDGDSTSANDGGTFNWPGGSSTNMETRGGGSYQSGDQVEGNVAAALGDLLDSANEGPASGPGDRVTEGVHHIWHTVYTQSDSNFAQWWNAYWAELGHEPCAPLAALQHNTMPYSVNQCGGGVACYVLTRTHTGSGADPVASPSNSPGCSTGQYVGGQSIQLTASPAAGSTVGSWSGTSNNASTSLANSLVMPAGNHTASVNYIVQPDIALSNGVAVGGSVNGSASYEQWDFYYVDLESGVDQLAVELYNMTADADLFLRYGAKPDLGAFDCVSAISGTIGDDCVMNAPASGRWWIGVANYAPGNITYTVKASWDSDLSGETSFYTVTPCRVLDTRPSSPLLSQVTRVIPVGGLCGIPSTAEAVAVNITDVSPTGSGFVTLWHGGTMPQVSAVNFPAARTRTNNAILALASDGSGTLSARAFVAGNGQVHLVVDVVGYFQ